MLFLMGPAMEIKSFDVQGPGEKPDLALCRALLLFKHYGNW